MQRLVFAALIGVGGLAILLYLGLWQVQRLAWKQDLLARIDAKITAEAVTLTDAEIPLTDNSRYIPVAVDGTFQDGHIRMLASRRVVGPVYRIIRPFEAAGFGRILIDTGWLAEGKPLPPVPSVPLTLIGNLDDPNEADEFTPSPDLGANLWFARDVPAMAAALNTQPILIVLRDAPDPPLGVTPWPVSTQGIPNDHLQYAITWFSLAIIWTAMTVYFVRRRPQTIKEE